MRWWFAGVLTVALVVALAVWIGGRTTGGPRAAADAGSAARAAAAASEAAAADLARRSALTTRLDDVLGGDGDTWSVSTRDLSTGVETDLGSTDRMYAGSTVKVLLLENLLREQGGVDELTDDERDAASDMITESSNDAAVRVWDAGGGDTALETTADRLGLVHTDIATGGYFGLTTTSASDQVKVLAELVTPTFLTAADAAYVTGLMADVESDQRWGVPTMADPGTAAVNKNGWLDNDDDDGAWLVNSLGIVTVGGTRYLVAAFSQHQPDYDTGVERLDTALAAVAADLRG